MININTLNIVAIVQARMGSTRFPGKAMREVLGMPLISFCVERLLLCKNLNKIVVAVPNNPRDQIIIDFCRKNHISYFIGSEDDVLDRYYQAALTFNADAIVRITGDCPLCDPKIVDEVIQVYIRKFPNYDYVSNVINRTYPRGLDVEVFSMECLEKMKRYAATASEKEHVTTYLVNHLDRFKVFSVTQEKDLSSYRWTVDTKEDFLLVKSILEALYPNNPHFSSEDILKMYEKRPEWREINSHIKQKEI